VTAPQPVGFWFLQGLKHVACEVNMAGGLIKAAVYDTLPDQDLDEFRSDITGEASGAGYPAGGQTVTGITFTPDATGEKWVISCNPISFPSSSITGRWLVFYNNTGSSATSALLFYVDARQEMTSSNDVWSFTPDAGGVATISTAIAS
jgi:hypothetical protein